MKLMVQSYNTGGSWNKEEEETKLRYPLIDHSFSNPADCHLILGDPTGALLRKYRTDTKVALSAGIEDDGGAQTDETTETNSAAANDMTLTPASPGAWAINDAYYYGFEEEVGGFVLNVGTAFIGAPAPPTVVWEYWDGDSWESLAGIVDGSNIYQNTGESSITWTIPGDWATSTENGQGPFYYVRQRITVGAVVGTQGLGTQAWYNRIWIGASKITLEYPDSTDVFYGRIKRVVGDTVSRTVTLECKDWLDQLDEEIITYEMREKLGTTDLRQSKLRSDVDGDRIPVENNGGVFSVFDDGDYDDDGGMAFVNDKYNGMKMFLTVGMAGTKTWTFHPFDSTTGGGFDGVYGDDVEAVWVNNSTVDGGFDDNNWTLEYHFHVELGHNTPSDFYVHDSITACRIKCVHQISQLGGTNHAHLQIYDNNAADWSADITHITEADARTEMSHTVPMEIVPFIVDATGELNLRYEIEQVGGNVTIAIYYLEVQIDTTSTGYNLGITINDTINPNELEIAVDPTAQATQLWENVPYCIAKPIYLHFESATGIINGGDDIVTLTCGAAQVENTTGYSTTQHKNKTRLQIAQVEARNDKSVFYMALGTTTVTYLQTFGANTETMTDGTPDNWHSLRDYNTVVNSVDAYGVRIGDAEIYVQSQDSESITTFIATRSKVIKNPGLVSFASASELGTAIVARDADIQQMVACTLSGFDDTYRLGTVVEITSSYLWANAAKDYVVTRWAYDGKTHKTVLTMKPVSTIGFQPMDAPIDTAKQVERIKTDAHTPDPITHEVS